ncbi:hypothetical protein BCF58_0561 [Chryseobacterium defluvii]|uniref:O-antigen ligase-related domain-containing protein n=1 Tax=Chryseobacterium defluvii TaxID=160396 RepID=A0A495SPA8_9FLAO|nr:hypothetical protein BCF58_0561 [Chryseobacterium defluvii]
MATHKINIFLSTLSFILCIIGYQLVTTIFLPSTSDFENISRAITVPYRALALAIMLAVIYINIRNISDFKSLPLVVLIIYWLALIVRIFSDNFLRTDYLIQSTSQLWLYVFGICMAALVSTIKSFKYIDLNKALHVVYISIIVILTITLFSNQALISNTDNEYRADANVALNTISYGNLGVMGMYMSLFMLLKEKHKLLLKIGIILVLILSVYSLLRSGSRGPILSFLVVVFFWFFSKGKNIMTGVGISMILLLVIYLLQDPILSLMGDISPVIEIRLRETISGSGPDERSLLHDAALKVFYEHPFIGDQFAIFNKNGEYAYAHNIILDSLIALGIIGGIMMAYILWSALKCCYKNIHDDHPHFWISLILVQQISSSMVSGAFYQDQTLTVLLVYHFILFRKSFIGWK